MNVFCCKRTYKARVYSVNSGGCRGAYYFILIIFTTDLSIYLFFICLCSFCVFFLCVCVFFPFGEGLLEIDVYLRME